MIDLIDDFDGVLFVEENRTVKTENIAYEKFEWFLDNNGEVFEGKADIDLNIADNSDVYEKTTQLLRF